MQRGDLRWMYPERARLEAKWPGAAAAASALAGWCPYEHHREQPGFQMTLLERAVNVVSPNARLAMMRNRFLVNFAGQFAGARHDKTSLRNFNAPAGSADADSIGDLQTLRARSRDLGRNAPIAARRTQHEQNERGGPGAPASRQGGPRVAWPQRGSGGGVGARTETLFHLWARSKTADVARRLNFYQMQALAFTSAWDSGDVFALRRYKEGTSFLALCVQLLEADRVSTPTDRQNDFYLRDGVELDEDGEVVAYHVLNRHPGDNPTCGALSPPIGRASRPRVTMASRSWSTSWTWTALAKPRHPRARAGHRSAQATGPLCGGRTHGRRGVRVLHGVHQDRWR
jgi:hypothetical protein